MSADEAVMLGIADRKVSDDRLDTAALDLARELAEGPTAAYAAIRRLTTRRDEQLQRISTRNWNRGARRPRGCESSPLDPVTRTTAVFTR